MDATVAAAAFTVTVCTMIIVGIVERLRKRK